MKWRLILEPDSETGDWAVWRPELPGCDGGVELKLARRLRLVFSSTHSIASHRTQARV